MNREPEKAAPTCAFSLRLEKELYDTLYEYSLKTGNSKNKILNIALAKYLKEAEERAS